MSTYQPPFTITPEILDLVARISEMLGRWSASMSGSLSPQLRRTNRILTIQASLAIENNTLSIEAVTDILEGKRVLGLPREIQEVRNAFATYDAMANWIPDSIENLLAAHELLMAGLVDQAGQFRSGGVGIYRNKMVVHMPPPASRVKILMSDLLAWLATTTIHPLVASCVFHYEFEFIHPFEDGNGRMGRLWQTLILKSWQPILAYLPVETVIRDQQEAYYAALSASDQASDATVFVEFMLKALYQAMQESSVKGSVKSSEKTEERILVLLNENHHLAIVELAEILKLSTRAVEKQIDKLKKQGRLERVGPAKGGVWNVLLARV